MLSIVVTMAAFFIFKTNALDLSYSGSSLPNNTGASATTSGFSISYSDTAKNICGYRFSIVSSNGLPKSGTKVANVYLSAVTEGTTAYDSGQRFIVSSGVVANKKQLANGTKVIATSTKQSCDYLSGNCGFYTALAQAPSSIGDWIKNSGNSYQNLSRIYVICGSNLANATESDYVLIEPIFWPKLAGTKTAATVTELAIYGAGVSGGDQYKGTDGNLYNAGSGTLWNLSNYINREFPNALYVSSTTDVYSAVTVSSSDKYIYKDIIQKGYGCSVLTVRNLITIKKVYITYHINGGTLSSSIFSTNQYGHISNGSTVYFQSGTYGQKINPYDAATFGLSRAGYQFAGWQVKSTGTVLNQSTDYDSTIYAHYNDSSKTTANTAEVYCYLIAQWTPNRVYLSYNINGGTMSSSTYSANQYGHIKKSNELYFHYIDYGNSSDLYDASTFGLTRTGYTFAGWKVRSTGTVLNQTTSYASTVFAQYDNSSKTTSNTGTVYCYLDAVWTPNKVYISYYADGGKVTSPSSLNQYGHISIDGNLYFHSITYGSTGNPYDAATFGLTKAGYQFAGWKVRSTGVILDETTNRDSTVYAQHDNSSKTTVNTSIVYCYLDAVWTPNKVYISYYVDGGKVTSPSSLNPYGHILIDGNLYFHTINYGSTGNPYDAATFGLTKTGYKFKGWKVRSTGVILDETTNRDSTVYAHYNDRSKTTANTKEVYCYLDAVWENQSYTNTIAHWKYVGSGGDNSNGTYKKMGTSTFTGVYASSVTIPSNLIQSYTGYYNTGIACSYWGSSSWSQKNIGSTFTQPSTAIAIEYYYEPKVLTVVFNKNDGSGSTASQNFTYAASGNKFGYNTNGTPKWSNNSGQFGAWDREGHTLLGWSESVSATSATYSIYSGVDHSWLNSKVSNKAATLNLYAVWSKNTYTNNIYNWAWGFNGNGNNGNRNALRIAAESFNKNYGDTFTLNDSNGTTIPNGFYLDNIFGTSSISDVWRNYNFGTQITQKAQSMSFEYDYYPYEYNITYELNGGTNNSNNPTTYNVLYEKTLSYPNRVGYEFLGWTRQIEKDKLIMSADTWDYHYTRVLNDIEPGTEYRISIANAKVTTGSASIFSACLYDFDDLTVKDFKNIAMGSNIEFTLYCPDTADTTHDICFLIYSGGSGNTSGIGTEFTNIKIDFDVTKINTGCNSAFSSSDELYSELAKRTTGDIKLIARWREARQITIVPVDTNAPYREDTEVITSFWLVNPNNIDYTNSNVASIAFSVYNQSGDKLTEEIQNFVCPENNKNLSFFRWSVPDGYGNQTLTVKAHIIDGTNEYGHIEEFFEIEPFSECHTPNTIYEDRAPEDFTVPYVTEDDNLNAKWWQWEYIDENFVKKEYAVEGIISDIVLSAPNSPSAYTRDDELYLKSGYGFKTSFVDNIVSMNGYETDSDTYTTEIQYRYALFPEYNYVYGTDTCRSIEISYDEMGFVYNDYMERQHFVPIYYPDGEYKFKIVLTDCWTPAGMLTTSKVLTININGNAYDDWYINHLR